MWDVGDCLSCASLRQCTETSVEKVLASYTCPLFTPVEEPIYIARLDMIQKYGQMEAVSSMVHPPLTIEEE